MKKLWLVSVAIFGCGGFGLWSVFSFIRSMPVSSTATPTPAPFSSPKPKADDLPQYQRFTLPNSEIHTVRISPESRFQVSIAVSPKTESIEQFAQSDAAIAVINGGFFDPKNEKTMSHVIENGKPVADPTQNERLTENPNLQPYLDQILNRSEFRRYECGEKTEYAIVPHKASVPSNCKLIDAIGGGPQLVPGLSAEAEGFVDRMVGRDSIGVQQRNARSAIGITRDGYVVLVMAAQKPEAPSNSGMSLQALATFMEQRLGVTQAMNLDGGSSSALFFKGETFYGKVDKEGQSIGRPIKSVVTVREK